MMIKKVFICFTILLLTAYPISAGEVSLNRWVLNVTLHDDETVDEAVQVEIDNGGSSPLEGFSFVVPASGVSVKYGFYDTFSSKGQVVEPQAVPGGTEVIVNFNESLKTGEKWDGRISFSAENWAVKEGQNYSINIPVQAPEAIASGKAVPLAVPTEADIRAQVFMPKSYDVVSVTPKPFRVLFQYDKKVPTWSPDRLHIGDTITVNSSFSSILNKIVENDEKYRELLSRVKEAKAQGKNVSDAETHLENVNDYNNRQAYGSYEDRNYAAAQEYIDYANSELTQAQTSLSGAAGQAQVPDTNTTKSTPGLGVAALFLVLTANYLLKRKK